MKTIDTTHDNDWEAFFENVTEDVSSFDWMLEKLEDNISGPDWGHWLLSTLGYRSRCIHALNILRKDDIPASVEPYREKLQLMFESADSDLNRLLQDHWPAISKQFLPGGNLWEHVILLENRLKSLRRAFQDRLLFQEETDPPSESLRDLSSDFLMSFAEVYRAAKDAPVLLADRTDFQSWRSHFSEMDRRFQDWFGYLEPVGDMLSQFHQREYQEDFWWLRQKPILSEIREPEMDDAWLQDIGRSEIIPADEICPESERVIAYAFHELMGQDRESIQNHVRSCSSCLNLVLDIRASRKEAEQYGQRPVEWATYLSEARQSHERKSNPAWWTVPAEAMLRDLSHRFGRIINWPQSIPATLKNNLELLFMAPFRAEALPLMAADHPGDVVIAKRITMGEDGAIQDISPVTVIIHHLVKTDETIDISGEFPNDGKIAAESELYFAWQNPDNAFRLLNTTFLERKGIYFIIRLEKPSDEIQYGRIQMIIR